MHLGDLFNSVNTLILIIDYWPGFHTTNMRDLRNVYNFKFQAFETVPISKHESVMKELASVMSREECLR